MKQAEKYTTRDKIMQAAEVLFMKKGFKATTIRTIAKEAKVNIALINYHFKSKEELYKELILIKSTMLSSKLDEIVKDNSLNGGEKLDKLIHTYAEFIYSNPNIARFLVSEMTMESEVARWIIKRYISKIFGKIMLIIKQAYDDGFIRSDIDISVLLPSIMGSIVINVVAFPMLQILFKKKPDELFKSKKRVEEIKDVIFNGIKK
ncbi:MAG: hypothetical protein A2Y62_09600 [Candidatus Fischerbacteria bacterium RBG_13_37_8]|uniref:HTH tetR-type domain-containing protein n=1 Tax=Candidatus Fischerbacteria bacterium RBG_13_37_8 TaxID=1817863 RepID=A0A1F5V5P9_9BACT|nr:MAG: hypothetical protein A2Y62_09600 [Candidatus Fischerbacteria bacterium RBG_13_37_8]